MYYISSNVLLDLYLNKWNGRKFTFFDAANNYIGRRNYIHNIYSTPIYSTFIILPKASRVWQVLICCCWLALDAGYRGDVLTTMVMRRRLLYSRNWFEVPKEASNHIVVLRFEKYKRNINFLWLLFLLEKCSSASSLFVE